MAIKKKKARKKGVNGKKKGGAFENHIIKVIAKPLAKLKFTEDDIYRTKNSGATKKQPGDLMCSPALAKILPVLFECKHYKNVKIALGKSLDCQPKSHAIRSWWEQLIREEKQYTKVFKKKTKPGLLIFRQNGCPILVGMHVEAYEQLIGVSPNRKRYSWSLFTTWKQKPVVFVPLLQFLERFVQHQLTIKKERKYANRNKPKHRNRHGASRNKSQR